MSNVENISFLFAVSLSSVIASFLLLVYASKLAGTTNPISLILLPVTFARIQLLVSFFKSDKPCAAGKKVLNEQMLLLNDETIHEDPFQPTASDIEEANHPENVIAYVDVDYDVEVLTSFKT